MQRDRVLLRCVATLADAHYLKGFLEAAGVTAEVRSHSVHPLGPVADGPAHEVWVDAAQRARAETLLQQAEGTNGRDHGELLCSNCGEGNPGTFEVCWRCGAPTRATEPGPRPPSPPPTPWWQGETWNVTWVLGAVILVLVLWSLWRGQGG